MPERQTVLPKVLCAIKDCLQELEQIKLIGPEDLRILRLRQTLRDIVGELEEAAQQHEKNAA